MGAVIPAQMVHRGGCGRGWAGGEKSETALAELYRETGHPDYLDLARQFVEQRGRGLAGASGRGRRYLQDHVPARSLDATVGHAVRALYLEAGVADVAAETGDRPLLETSLRRWDDMVATRPLPGHDLGRHAVRPPVHRVPPVRRRPRPAGDHRLPVVRRGLPARARRPRGAARDRAPDPGLEHAHPRVSEQRKP